MLGQRDFTTALINYPSGNPNTPNNSGLNRPIGLLVDSNGNLYVADSLNGRVLRFPAPFAYQGQAPEQADLVLGQQNFTTTIADPTNTNMADPRGLAFTPSCNSPGRRRAPPRTVWWFPTREITACCTSPPISTGRSPPAQTTAKRATIVFGQTSFNAKGVRQCAPWGP